MNCIVQAAVVGESIQKHFLSLKCGRGTLPRGLQRIKKTLLACGVPDNACEDAELLYRVAAFFGFHEHHLDFKSILVHVDDGADGGLHGSPLLVALDQSCRRKSRCDKLSGHPVFTVIWHELTTAHKGERKKRKMMRQKDIISVNGKMRAVSVFVTHQERMMEDTVEEIHARMLTLPAYLAFREEYMALNPRLPPDWQVAHLCMNLLTQYRVLCVCVCVCMSKVNRICIRRLGSSVCRRRSVSVLTNWRIGLVAAQCTFS